MSLYALIYTPGPNWIPGKPVTEQPLQDHLNYMLQLNASGTLVAGGPLVDNAGGLIVINAESPEAAQAVMQRDPAIVGKIVNGQLHPWYPLINRWTGENHLVPSAEK